MMASDVVPNFGPNLIGPPALTLFVAILGMVTTIVIELIRVRRRVEKSIQNTDPISNGFTEEISQSLKDLHDSVNHVSRRVDRMSEDFRQHLLEHGDGRRRNDRPNR
jgi:hypothetical protein